MLITKSNLTRIVSTLFLAFCAVRGHGVLLFYPHVLAFSFQREVGAALPKITIGSFLTLLQTVNNARYIHNPLGSELASSKGIGDGLPLYHCFLSHFSGLFVLMGSFFSLLRFLPSTLMQSGCSTLETRRR